LKAILLVLRRHFWKDSSTDIYNFLHTENGKTEIYRFWTEYFMGIM